MFAPFPPVSAQPQPVYICDHGLLAYQRTHVVMPSPTLCLHARCHWSADAPAVSNIPFKGEIWISAFPEVG